MITSYAHDLYSSATLAFAVLSKTKTESWSLEMQPWRLQVHDKRSRGQEHCVEVIMGAIVKYDRGCLAYQSIPVNVIVGPKCFTHAPPWCSHTAVDSTASSVRRLHFDFDANVSNWPKHHLQIGGNASELTQMGAYHRAFAEDPSEPRVPTTSLDIVLALDLVLREFATQISIPQDSEWRGLVLRSEELVLKPYFQGVMRHLDSNAEKPPLIEHLAT